MRAPLSDNCSRIILTTSAVDNSTEVLLVEFRVEVRCKRGKLYN